MSQRPTVIIGGGVVGVCAAYSLARAGREVVLLERDGIAAAASSGNAGQMAIGHPPIPRPGLAIQAIKWMFDKRSPLHISPTLGGSMIAWLWRFHRACTREQLERSMVTLSEMGRRTAHLFDEIIEREHIDCHYQRAGIMDVYRTERGMEQGRRQMELMQRHGLDVVELNGDEVLQREPAFKPPVAGAVFNRESTSLDPERFVTGVARAAERCGCVIRTGADVKRIVVEGGAARAVETTDGESIKASNVVIAAGIWSTALAASIGVRLPMQAGKGYHREIEQDEPRLTTPCVLAERFVAVTPLNGRLRLAGTLEFSGVNSVMRRERIDAICDGARTYLTGVEGKQSLSDWCGLRPCTADGLPVIGWAPGVQGVCIATGHAMLGMTLGPVSGELVAQLIGGQTPSVDLTPMRADRF